MNKELLIPILIIAVCLMFVACDIEEVESTSEATINTANDRYMKLYVDEETGVEYLIYGTTNGIGMTPRYLPNGDIKTKSDL